MKIYLSPQRRDDTLVIEHTAADRLRINGELFNFGPLDEGDTILSRGTPCEWVVGPVYRLDGEIHLTLVLPHGTSPDAHVAFPAPIIDPPIGPIDLPFSAWSERIEEKVEGGVNLITTVHSWQKPDETIIEFIPDEEEENNVDA